MSVMLATTNPQAVGELEPSRDHRSAYVGQWVIFHTRPGEGRGGTMTTPALVLRIHDEDHVDLLIKWGQEDEIERQKIPRKTDQNNFNAWSFNADDEFNYRDDSPLREAVKALADEVKELSERIAALEPPKRGPGRPPKIID